MAAVINRLIILIQGTQNVRCIRCQQETPLSCGESMVASHQAQCRRSLTVWWVSLHTLILARAVAKGSGFH